MAKGVLCPRSASLETGCLLGHSVVQRQLWLMENEGVSRSEAYDKARKEFYDLRMQEDIERRIAAEEARATGAYFGKTYIEVGVELERKVLEEWKEKATQMATLKKGRLAAMSGVTETEDDAPAGTETLEVEAAESETA